MRLNKLFAALFAVTLTGSSLLMVGCGSETSSDAAKTVDTREVTKPAEPSVPSLDKRVDGGMPAAFTAAPAASEPDVMSQAIAEETNAPAQPPMMTEVVPAPAAPAPQVVAANGQQLYSSCMGCHGMTGGGGVGPQLQGQSRDDIITKMTKYRAGEQVGPMTAMMAPMAANLKDAEIEALADYIITF